MNRRRFLSLSAAFACAPHLARASTWRGYALGAEVSVQLSGPREMVDGALHAIPAQLELIEELFSLYRPGSVLSRLNATGRINAPGLFRILMGHVTTAHRLTGGLFDPTIQPLWRALALGTDPDTARAFIGWDRVHANAVDDIRLGTGQQITLNGIAQGFATDLIRDNLKTRGFSKALINIGEMAALGGPFVLGVDDPDHGQLATRRVSDRAIATSSPRAMHLRDAGHILSPDGRPPIWSTVTIEGPSATMADALSTAAVFMPVPALRVLKRQAGLLRITVITPDGDLFTL